MTNEKNKLPITSEERLLAAMVYGEALTLNDANELKAIASVLVRQKTARGYETIAAFVKKEPTYAFIVRDGNARYKKFNNAKDDDVYTDAGMTNALNAARNALSGGEDLSNGAYFWDGRDIETNYSKHFKVKHGIKITEPSHNVFNIKDSVKLVIVYKDTITKEKIKDKNKKGKAKEKTERSELGRYDHVYESTAGYGGTIFWKNNPDYISLSKGKEYK